MPAFCITLSQKFNDFFIMVDNNYQIQIKLFFLQKKAKNKKMAKNIPRIMINAMLWF